MSAERKLAVAGTQRSGHHAILMWLYSQLPGATEYHNSCTLPEFERGEIVRMGNARDHIITYGDGPVRNRVYSFESYTFDEMAGVTRSPLMADGDARYVLVLRDVYNMLASSIKSTVTGDITGRLEDRVARWKTHARNFGANDTWTRVNYNRWTADAAYRKELCDSLGIQFTDAGRSTVSPQGGGSSFDRRSCDGNAEDMDVLNRWQHYITDAEFLRMTADPEIAELNKRIFGFDLNDLKRRGGQI